MINARPFEVRTDLDGVAARVALFGELDIATVPRVEEAVDDALGRGARDLLVDLAGLEFVDSSGLRLLIAINDRAASEGWSLRLTRPSERSRSVFEITGAERNLPFVDEPPTG